MTTVIRADASAQIGTGHVMRCLNLARYLRKSGEDIKFACAALEGNLIHRIRDEGFPCIDMEFETTSFLENSGYKRLIIDHYGLDINWERIAKLYVNSVVVIDDFADRKHECDIYINPNDLEPDLDAIPNDCLVFSGLRYALMDPIYGCLEFTMPSEKVSDVLVCMGGSDPTKELLKCAEAFKNNTDVTFHFIAGISNIAANELKAVCESFAHYNYYNHCENLPKFASRMDIAVTAGGSMLREFMAMGLPSLVITTNDVQIDIVNALKERAAIAYIGHFSQAAVESIRCGFNQLKENYDARKTMVCQGRKIVDGQGVRRISNALTVPDITLRPADMKDAEMVYQWRIHPQARKFSGQREIFDYKSHLSWFEAALMDKERCFLIAENSSNLLGVLRFDGVKSKSVVSVYLNPDCYGSGYGAFILQAGIRYLKKNNIMPIRIEALIDPENVASRLAFKKAGFTIGYKNIFYKDIK